MSAKKGADRLEATSENLAQLRKEFETNLAEIDKEVDTRDVERIRKDDVYASYFLNWNKSMSAASEMLVNALKWRQKNCINDLTVESIGEDTFKKGYLFVLGRAVDGTRVLYFQTGRLQKAERETNMKLLIFWLERVQRREPGKKITFVMDTTDSSLSQADMGFSTFIIQCFAAHFPGLLQRIIIYNLPWILNATWSLISKTMSQDQQDATKMCGKKDVLKFIDVDNLTVEMGGNIKYQYSFPPFPDDLGSSEK